jgi:hypothetical protein
MFHLGRGLHCLLRAGNESLQKKAGPMALMGGARKQDSGGELGDLRFITS